MHVNLGAISLLVGAVSTLASQFPLNTKFEAYDAGLINQVDDIRGLPTHEYTTLTHPAHPHHRVRIKQNGADSCDNSVKSYTGYIDIESRHLFFWFFESRNDPSQDDVVMWINGGPGCSSSLGLFMELGPCNMQFNGSTTYNPYSWIETANVFFIDQPVGVGYSYADHGYVSTSEEAAKDISAFVRIFFDNFHQFKGRNFNIAGESYGGRYIPAFGARILDDNEKAIQKGLEPIKLTSVMIGNGLTDPVHMKPSYYDIQCTGASIKPFQSIENCVRMKKAVPRCEKWLQRSCIDVYDEMDCRAADNFCETEFTDPFVALGKNIYDVSQQCAGNYDDSLCYPITIVIAEYLNKEQVKVKLGVDAAAGNFSACSNQVGTHFNDVLDSYAYPAAYYVAQLLERDIKVLIYVGTYDMICNWVGNERFTVNLEWSGQEGFINQKYRDWTVDTHTAGKTRTFKNLTFATILGAGHQVPYDKPVEALAMITRWLKNEEL